jgi:hypothetical protein
MKLTDFKPKLKEKDLHKSVVKYLKLKYPNVIFNTDMAGVQLAGGRQGRDVKELRSSNSFPDITIYKPMNGYYGLFIELKTEGTILKNKDGSFREKIKPQAEFLERLCKLGYRADFAVGFDRARDLIDGYFAEF